jgi:CheY-like chemotaxis protein
VLELEGRQRLIKRILVVDDDPDVTLTLKMGFDHYHHDDNARFEVHSYNDPELALTEFKPSFYDLIITDVYMLGMNGVELGQKLMELDTHIKVCFMSGSEVNIDALREVYPEVSFECFIKKPVTINMLVKRLLVELY